VNSVEIYRGLSELLADIFMRDDIVASPELSAGDVEGWDSFKQIEIVMAAEDRFGIKFSSRELDDLSNLGVLASLIAAKTAA
jgi:acyl carrier protein